MSGWVGIILAGLSMLLAALIAAMVVRNAREHRLRFLIVLLISFILIDLGLERVILPKARDYALEFDLNRELLEISVYRVVAAHHPGEYSKILTINKEGRKKGESVNRTQSKTRPILMKVLWQHVPTASEEAVYTLFSLLVRQIDILCEKDPAACYQLMFEPDQLKTDVVAYFGPGLVNEESDVMAEAIRTSAEAPAKVPSKEEVDPILGKVFENLRSKLGEDVLLLADPSKPGVDRARICCMTGAFYKEILALPKHEAVSVLRLIAKRI